MEKIFAKQTVYIGMGSSMGSREKILEDTIIKLKEIGKNLVVAPFFENPPWGGVAQNMFLNTVLKMEVSCSAEYLLDCLQTLEKEAGRNPSAKWDDRPLDLDILFFGTEKISTKRLQIPHPFFQDRDFVMVPLQKIFPDFLTWYQENF